MFHLFSFILSFNNTQCSFHCISFKPISSFFLWLSFIILCPLLNDISLYFPLTLSSQFVDQFSLKLQIWFWQLREAAIFALNSISEEQVCLIFLLIIPDMCQNSQVFIVLMLNIADKFFIILSSTFIANVSACVSMETQISFPLKSAYFWQVPEQYKFQLQNLLQRILTEEIVTGTAFFFIFFLNWYLNQLLLPQINCLVSL